MAREARSERAPDTGTAPYVLTESVRSLRIQMVLDGEVLTTATGFLTTFDGRTFLITSRHNLVGWGWDGDSQRFLDGANRVPTHVRIHHIVDSDDPEAISWTVREEVLIRSERPLWLEHPILGSRADIVALPIQRRDGVRLDGYDLFKPPPALYYSPPAEVSVIGFPLGQDAAPNTGDNPAIWTRATVATDPTIDYSGLPTFLIDGFTRRGLSGAPVIAYRIPPGAMTLSQTPTYLYGPPEVRLVGVHSGKVAGDDYLGRVWKIEAVQEIVESGVQPMSVYE